MHSSKNELKVTNNPYWQIWIDTGGTFTDCLALDPQGEMHHTKVLSNSALRGTIVEVISPKRLRVRAKWDVPSDFIRGFQFSLLNVQHPPMQVEKYNPATCIIELNQPISLEFPVNLSFEMHSPEEAPILAARLVTRTPMGSLLPEIRMRLATTRGTNALLERDGAPIALFITRGFGDLLRIGTQQRPDLFALDIREPEPLYRSVVEVHERITADGTIHKPLRIHGLKNKISQLLQSGIRGAAIALMNSYVNPAHERKLAEFLWKCGFEYVSCSSDLAPFIKILHRAETAVVDAYLSSVIATYLKNVQKVLFAGKLHVMTSAGGLIQHTSYHAKDSLLSGPAGGVVGAVLSGRRSGFERIIAFDMGGTSTDVARFDGDYDYVFEHKVGDAHLVAPALAIESVASGGGSICTFDGMELKVGPESAGAYPGPACYGAGGPLTLTDVNLLLGRLDGSRFDIPIDIHAARCEFEKIRMRIKQEKHADTPSEELLIGFHRIANERMADAIRRISIRKGYDPKKYVLVAFGGAGGQHACAVAELLGIDIILIPRDAGLLSALGLGHAVIERFAEQQLLKPLHFNESQIPRWMEKLSNDAVAKLEQEGVAKQDIQIRRRIVNMRFVGQDSVIQIEYNPNIPIQKEFESKYRAIFGHWQEDHPLEVESIRVVASSKPNKNFIAQKVGSTFKAESKQPMHSFFEGKWQSVSSVDRSSLSPGAMAYGPVLISEQYSMTVVEKGWYAEVDSAGSLLLRKTQKQRAKTLTPQSEVVRLELFTNRFQTIAHEMGEMLRRTAISTNVKERLDFSCAILDRDGYLVVNAPHIPVHLGSMGLCVRKLKETLSMEPGDVVVTNHPAFGGSHLPDITVVSPVFLKNHSLLGYVANRAHHAEIGGIRPGSMPSMATSLGEEGVVIPPMYLVKNGIPRWEEFYAFMQNTPFPSRSIEENIADLKAAVAANRSGTEALLQCVKSNGETTVQYYMEALKRRAESKIRSALKTIPDGTYCAQEQLDDGSPIQVAIRIQGDEAFMDFSGSAEVHPHILNATPAIVNSVVIYVMRLLLDEPLPLNEGLMRAIALHIPPGILNPPFPNDPFKSPAVSGGNVETSQRLVDTILKALKLVACSQGTMNNVLFGNDNFSYYETVGGGCGAGPNFHGADAVHSHMTNTQITDPEIIEHRFPVRVERFAIRKKSGGKGKYCGGDGIIRELVFLKKSSLSVLGQHRSEGPYGLAGGRSGKPAKQTVIRASGKIVALNSIDGIEINPGDRFRLETPGGGGYGSRRKS